VENGTFKPKLLQQLAFVEAQLSQIDELHENLSAMAGNIDDPMGRATVMIELKKAHQSRRRPWLKIADAISKRPRLVRRTSA
jgi:hypothetical protein